MRSSASMISRSYGTLAPAHLVAQHADPLDLDLDDVARDEPDLRVAEDADALRRAGQDEVSRLEGDRVRDVTDERRYVEDQVTRPRVLEDVGVQALLDAQVGGIE